MRAEQYWHVQAKTYYIMEASERMINRLRFIKGWRPEGLKVACAEGHSSPSSLVEDVEAMINKNILQCVAVLQFVADSG